MNEIPDKFFSALIDTAELPDEEQFSFWREGIGTWAEIERESDYRAPFHSKISHFQTSGIILNKYDRMSQGSTNRSNRHIAQDGVDMIGFDIRLEGLERNCRFKGEDTLAKPGDIRVYDVRQPFYVDNENFKTFALWVNRAHFEDRLAAVENFHGLLLGAGPLDRLFKAHVKMTFELLKEATPFEAQKLAAVTSQMAVELLDMQSIGSLESEVISDNTIRKAINGCIQKHMTDPNLSPDTIAKNVGVSRSKLYRVCKPIGSPMEVVRRARLHKAAQLLKSGRAQYVSCLAYAVGFGCRQSFGRAFKTEFQSSPKEYLHEMRRPPHDLVGQHEKPQSWGNVVSSVEAAMTKRARPQV